MSFNFGSKIKLTIFGQSHSEMIGAVIDGLPAGEYIDIDEIQKFMCRRAPGRNEFSTSRMESDIPEIVSGLVGNMTCGAPLTALIRNTDTNSADYSELKTHPRPSHADYAAYVKYGGFNDILGGGQFSGRLTAPLCFAGAVCKQFLRRRGIHIGAHAQRIGGVSDEFFSLTDIGETALDTLANKIYPVISESALHNMLSVIENARIKHDSVGGIIECAVIGIGVGIGEHMFDGIENRISLAVFGVPAVKGIEFGAGFSSADMCGSMFNDEMYWDCGNVKTKTNNNGGITGGMTNGMPIVFRCAVKPTPSIAVKQNTVNLADKIDCTISVGGRHDSCIAMRAVPCIEAATAVAIADLVL